MAFYFEKTSRQLIDPEGNIVITSRGSGVGMEWRRVFEYSGPEGSFYFFARAMKQIAPDRWTFNDHWSLDGVPRVDRIKLSEKQMEQSALATAFRNIVRALPHFPLVGIDNEKDGKIEDVRFDLHGERTQNPTL